MKNRKTVSKILIILVISAILFGCKNGDQFAEASNLVSEINKKIVETEELLTTTEHLYKSLFGANIHTADELADYKKSKSVEAKSLIADHEKIYESLKEISKLFDDISRMILNPKYKEYAKLKSDEYAKRAEAVNVRKGNAQAFLEIDDQQKMTARFDENTTKSNKILNEADEIGRNAQILEAENRDVFADLNQ